MLDNFSTDELQAELERRQKAEKQAEKPRLLDGFNLRSLIEVCQSYIDDLDKNGYVDDDHSHYIFEAAMETFFGKGVWDWINKDHS